MNRKKDVVCMDKNRVGLKASMALSASVCFMFFLYAPLELYFMNKDEFWYDIWVLAPIMLCVFLAFTGICIAGFALLYKCGGNLFRTAVLFLFVLFVCSYVQGNYFIKYLPVFDGRAIDWSLYAGVGRTQSAILWCVITGTVVFLYRRLQTERLYKVIQTISVCLLLLFLVTLSALCMTNQGLESKNNICVTTDYELSVSTDRNFIILLLDALDGGAFSDIVVGDEELESVFTDFTFYDNTLSAYPFTGYNVPYILSGMWFENRTERDVYFREVATESPFFETLESRGYTLGLYDVDLRIDEKTGGRFENIGTYTKRVSSYTDFIRWQIMLVGMKYAPFDLKRFSFVNPNAFENLRVLEGESEAFRDSNNRDFYDMLTQEELQYRNDKSFKFIHLWGSHPPYEYDKDLNYLPEGGTLAQSVEACITLSDRYLRKLKEGNVYDNSIIIIMSDHGNSEYYEEDNMNQHPILLIKGVDERHAFQVDHRAVSFAELQAAYSHLLDGGDGRTVFDGMTQMGSRRFLWYDIKDDTRIVEYEQTGQAGDMNTTSLTGREFNAR